MAVSSFWKEWIRQVRPQRFTMFIILPWRHWIVFNLWFGLSEGQQLALGAATLLTPQHTCSRRSADIWYDFHLTGGLWFGLGKGLNKSGVFPQRKSYSVTQLNRGSAAVCAGFFLFLSFCCQIIHWLIFFLDFNWWEDVGTIQTCTFSTLSLRNKKDIFVQNSFKIPILYQNYTKLLCFVFQVIQITGACTPEVMWIDYGVTKAKNMLR